MSDFTMKSSEENSSGLPVWDISVSGGIAKPIQGIQKIEQQAATASFQNIGSIPQLPGVGVPWIAFFNRQVSFTQLDSAIKLAILGSGAAGYTPKYSVVNGKLNVSVIKAY